MFEQIIEEIKKYDTIIIHRHSKPDGDALGAQIGLKHIIKDNFPEKEVWMVGDEAKRYAFMDDSIMDDIPDEIYVKMALKDVRIVYRRECMRGDTVTVKTFLSETEKGKTVDSFLYEGDAVVAQVITEWT